MTNTPNDLSMPPSQSDNPTHRVLQSNAQLAVGVLAIVVITLGVYMPAIRGDFIWNDSHFVSANAFMTSWDGLQRIWFGILPKPTEYGLLQYYPMTHTSFWIEYRLWGLNPLGYHIDNVLLHIIDALLLWLLLKKLEVPGAWLAGIIFAIHPIQVESVAWIAERKNVLSLMFFLSSLYIYLRYSRIIAGLPEAKIAPATVDPGEQPDIVWFKLPDDPARLYGLAVVLFLCALFSSSATWSLPLVILFITIWKRGGRLQMKDIPPLLPLLAVGIAMLWFTSYMEYYVVGIATRPRPWHYADSALGQFAAQTIIAGEAIWFYVVKLLFPIGLAFNYPRWGVAPSNASQYLFPASALIIITATILLRKRLGWPVIVAILYFVVTLFPVLGFIPIWSMQFAFVADHFVYLSSIGLIALFAAILTRNLPAHILQVVAVLLIFILGALTFNLAKQYRDMPTLWRTTWTRSNHKSWMAANNYGEYLLQDGLANLYAAEDSFKQALTLKPDYSEARLNLAKVAYARAVATDNLVRRAATTTQSAATMPQAAAPATRSSADYTADAIGLARQALDYEPEFYPAHYFLGVLLLSTGQDEEAKKEFRACIEIYPRHLQSYLSLGNLAVKEGNLDAAVSSFYHAAVNNQDSSEAHSLLGTTLLQRGGEGDAQNGLEEWDNAMKLDPKNFRLPLQYAVMLASNGRYMAADKFFRDAQSISPDSPEIYTAWGITAARAGKAKEARELFNRALQVDPTYALAKEKIEALDNGQLQPATTRSTSGPATNVAN